MSDRTRKSLVFMIGGVLCENFATAQSLPNLFPLHDGSGFIETYNDGGEPIDLTGPFFQSLGTNERSCASRHRPAAGWSLSAAEVRHRFNATQGFDPIFRTNDGITTSIRQRSKAGELPIGCFSTEV